MDPMMSEEDPGAVSQMDRLTKVKEMISSLSPAEQQQLPTTLSAVGANVQAEKAASEAGTSKFDVLQRTLAGKQDKLSQEILDLSERQATKTPLRRDQAVAAILLAAIPMIGGAIAGGRRGLQIGAQAGQLGATTMLDEIKTENKEQDKLLEAKAELKRDELKETRSQLGDIQKEDAKAEARKELEAAKPNTPNKDEELVDVLPALRDQLKKALPGSEIPEKVTRSQLEQLKGAAGISRTKETEERQRGAEERRDSKDDRDQATLFRNVLEARIPGHKFKTGSDGTPVVQPAEVSMKLKKVAADKAKVDQALVELDQALRSGDPQRRQQVAETMAEAIFAIKEARNLGAAFSQMERGLVDAVLPGVDITELSTDQIRNALNSRFRGQVPLDVVKRARERLDRSYWAGMDAYGLVRGDMTNDDLFKIGRSMSLSDTVVRRALGMDMQGSGGSGASSGVVKTDANGVKWRVFMGPDGKPVKERVG